MNIENLLAPDGGSGFAGDINRGILNLVGFSMEAGLASKLYAQPALKGFNKAYDPDEITRHWAKNAKSAAYEPIPKSGKPAPSLLPKQLNAIEAFKRNQGAFKASLRADVKYAKLIGRAFIFDFGLAVGLRALTPGVTKSVYASNMNVMADERFIDSGRAATMRQRALQAIHDSQLSVRNVIGNEASFLHQ